MAWKQQGVFSEVVAHRHLCPLLRKWRETSRQQRLFSPDSERRVAGVLRADMVAFLRRSAAKMAGNLEAAAATARDVGHEPGPGMREMQYMFCGASSLTQHPTWLR